MFMKEYTGSIQFVSLLLFFSTRFLLAGGQENKTSSKEVEKEIRMVDDNLTGWLTIWKTPWGPGSRSSHLTRLNFLNQLCESE